MVNFRGGCITLSSFLLGVLGSLIAYTIYINASHQYDAKFPWWAYLVFVLVFLISVSLLRRIVKVASGPQPPVVYQPPPQGTGAYQQVGHPTYQPPPQAPGAYQQGGQPYSRPAPGTMLFIYRGHAKAVHAVSWSPDGSRIASGSYDKTVQIWDPITGNTLLTYRGYSDIVEAVAWSPDGRLIACGGNERVQVWDSVTGSLVSTYRKQLSVKALAWSPDGTRIASGSYDQTVQMWLVL
jgi:WD domain, G-beta repeat